MQDFRTAQPDNFPEQHRAQIEKAFLEEHLRYAGQEGSEQQKAVWASWLQGMFLSAVCDLRTVNPGLFEWVESTATTRDLMWTSPTGFVCPLARIYLQPNGTWAALVNAGVGERHPEEAMAKAEWAIQRLSG